MDRHVSCRYRPERHTLSSGSLTFSLETVSHDDEMRHRQGCFDEGEPRPAATLPLNSIASQTDRGEIMSSTNEATTLVCLFHHVDQATAALNDLRAAGVPQSSISVIGGTEETADSGSSSLASLGIPSRDLKHLQNGLDSGGRLVVVSAIREHIAEVERIFGKHKASKIDEAVRDDEPSGVPLPIATPAANTSAATSIPIVEEDLQVGKRTVDQGGVRVYRRIVEIPADQSITLREEHVVVERNPVDRLATQADLDGQQSRSFELTETAEEAVVNKTAHVVEEVLVSKQAAEHTEHIQDTVRRTEVEIEDLPASTSDIPSTSKRSI